MHNECDGKLRKQSPALLQFQNECLSGLGRVVVATKPITHSIPNRVEDVVGRRGVVALKERGRGGANT